MPDLTSARKVQMILLGRTELNFKKVVRILLTLVPSMVLLAKQFLDHKTTAEQMKRY